MSMAHSSGFQLPLNIQLRDEATLENFLPIGGAAPLFPVIGGGAGIAADPLVLVHGGQGVGKSHLLQAACHTGGHSAAYLPLAELADFPGDSVLADMERMTLVCLDDLDAVAGDAGWETALFHFLNRARDAGCRLFASAARPPRGLAIQLDDLQSRLAWGVVYHLRDYTDEEKIELLGFRAARRGLSLPGDVARFLVHRAPRDLGQLLALLDLLDRHSLAEQRALTVPFLKDVLGW